PRITTVSRVSPGPRGTPVDSKSGLGNGLGGENQQSPAPSLFSENHGRGGVLDAALGDPAAGLVRAQRRTEADPRPALPVPRPETPQLHAQAVREEHVRSPAALRNLAPHSDAHPHDAARAVHVADVEADDLAQAQAGAEGEGDDDVVAEVA